MAVAGREAGRCVADAMASEVAVASHGLGPDQAEAVQRLTLQGEALACVVGPAGAGKSRAMGAAAEAWNESGMAVRGLAVSAAAAGVLAAEAGIASETIAKFLYEHDSPNGPGEPWRLSQGEVVVVDEAAMVASADLARVVALAADAQAKVVLVGDHRQLGAVEAGGLFRLLAAETNAAELTGVRRFSTTWEREASLRLRNGDRSGVEEYLSRGRVVGGQRQVMVEEAFVRWELARVRGDSVVVCATDHATVDQLAARARAAQAPVVATGNDLISHPHQMLAGQHTLGLDLSGRDSRTTCPLPAAFSTRRLSSPWRASTCQRSPLRTQPPPEVTTFLARVRPVATWFEQSPAWWPRPWCEAEVRRTGAPSSRLQPADSREGPFSRVGPPSEGSPNLG